MIVKHHLNAFIMKIHKNRLLIIGSGNIFKKHIDVIHKQNNDFEISGIVEKDIKKINQLKKKYKYPIFKDLKVAIKNCQFDLACVLTDSGSHAKIAIEILKSGKSVIIEKPIALSLVDAEKIVKLEQNSKGLNVFVVKQNRFNVAIVKLKEAIKKKRFGKIFLATIRVRWKRDRKYYESARWRGKWRTDGGVLCNQAIHHIDLLQWLVGDVKKVFSMNSTVSAPIETEDTAVGVLKFKNGASGIIEATTACRPSNLEGSISILGTKGTVIIDGFSANKITEWNFIKKNKSDKSIIKGLDNPKNVFAYAHSKFYEYVHNQTRKKNKNNFLNAKEATKSLKIVNALIKSNFTKKEVFLSKNLLKTKLGR